MDWKSKYQDKVTTVEEAAKHVKSNDRVWISLGNCIPRTLVEAVVDNHKNLKDVDMFSGLVMYPLSYFKPEYKGHFRAHTFFMGAYERMFKNSSEMDIASVQVSQIGNYAVDVVKPNIMLCAVSEPDQDGNVNFGPFGVVANKRVAEKVDKIVVQINKSVPFVHGINNTINLSEVDVICEANDPMVELPNPPVSEIDKKIASFITPLIPDGSTIQIGIGGTSNAVAYSLEDKKDLGVHTEMLTDSLVHLIKKGAITGTKKNHQAEKIVFTFSGGNNELYDFINDNSDISIQPCEMVNSPLQIAKNDNLMSINNGLMIDLSGQTGSESIGTAQFSGTGGQLDFVLGARLSRGGKSFITLPSTAKTKTGLESRIMLALPEGTAVTTPRSYVEYIVTEWGIADLKNKSLSQRAIALIEIAHPDFREELTNQAKEAGILK
jgi:4-hydroxybutyrate CoA-transferase